MLTKGSAPTASRAAALLASNKVSTTAQASIDHTAAPRYVAAGERHGRRRSDAPSIEARTTVVQRRSSRTPPQASPPTSTGLLPHDYDYTTKSGTGTVASDGHVRVAADDGRSVSPATCTGPTETTTVIDFANENYLDTDRWTDLDLEPTSSPTSIPASAI